MKKGTELMDEFIGTHCEVLDSPDPTLVGSKGTVLNETKNTIVIKPDGSTSRKVIPKHHTRFGLVIGELSVQVDGGSIAFRPEDRIKRAGRKKQGHGTGNSRSGGRNNAPGSRISK